MRYIRPIFYDTFCCIADQCPDTCCAGWQIMIDEESMEKYAQVEGPFGKRLRNSIDWQESCFYQDGGRCAFLNDKNLCDLYSNLGSEALCETCRKYPRHVEEYEGLREWSLSLSCPVAARMILSQQGFPEFVEEEDNEPDELEDEFEEFDLLLFTKLEDARNAIFRSLKQGSDHLHSHMYKALSLAQKMQECLEEGHIFEMDDLIQSYEEGSFVWETMPVAYERSKCLYEAIYDLERLRPEWGHVLEKMYQALYADGEENYTQLQKEFQIYLAEHPKKQQLWENGSMQLFVFFVYTYFCGAVYDDWIYSKMALAVYSVEFIRELLLAEWKQTGKLEMKNYVELSYGYAREIEHSDENLNQLEEFSRKVLTTK